AEDGGGGIWVGTGEGSLCRLEQDKFIEYRASDSLASHAIWSLLADNDGTIWAGTFRGGLLRFKDGKFTRFTTENGLPSDVICQILDDGAGNLWIGSHKGIFRVSRSALQDCARGEAKTIPCTTFGRYDGLPTLECSGNYQPSAWRGKDGRLW